MLNQRVCWLLCLILLLAVGSRGADTPKAGTKKIPANVLKKIKEMRAKAKSDKQGNNNKPEPKPTPQSLNPKP